MTAALALRMSTPCLLAFALVPVLAPQQPVAEARPESGRQRAAANDRVAGRVISAADGHGIPNAIVTLQDDVPGTPSTPRQGRGPRFQPGNAREQVIASTRADAEGRYRFDPQPAGKYSLRASASGYLSAAYLEHGGFSTAVVLGKDLATDTLQLVLTPSGTIFGRVLDEAGDAVQRAQVMLYRENPNANTESSEISQESNATGHVQRVRGVTTNDDGTYEFPTVAPGRYFVAASGMPWYAVHPRVEPENAALPFRSNVDRALDVAYPELFYPNSTDSSAASPIVLRGGERVAANFTMQPEPALTLRVRQPSGGREGAFPQLMRMVFGNPEPVQFQVSGQTGQEVVLSGLTAGQYQLQSFGNRNGLQGPAVAVTLASGAGAIEAPQPTASDSATLHITLQSVGGTVLPNEIQLNLRRVSPQGGRPDSVFQHLKETGEATLANVPAGEYRFSLFTNGHLLNVMSLSVDGQKAAGTLLHVTGKGDLKVDLAVTSYAPALEGFARRDGKAFPGAMVVLVPAGTDTSSGFFRRDQSDLDGSFHLNNVVPGNYLLVAIDDGWKLPRWNDAAALTPYLTHGLPVTVANNGSDTIHLSDAATVQAK